MRIVEDTPERMVLRDRSLWTSFVFAPLGLLVAYLAPTKPPFASYVAAAVMVLVAVIWFSSTDLVLDRVSRTCDLRRLTLGGVRRWSLAFDDIHDVRLERTEGRSGPNYRLLFVTAAEEIPLSGVREGARRGRYEAMQKQLLDVLRGPAAATPTSAPRLPPAPDIVQSV